MAGIKIKFVEAQEKSNISLSNDVVTDLINSVRLSSGFNSFSGVYIKYNLYDNNIKNNIKIFVPNFIDDSTVNSDFVLTDPVVTNQVINDIIANQ